MYGSIQFRWKEIVKLIPVLGISKVSTMKKLIKKMENSFYYHLQLLQYILTVASSQPIHKKKNKMKMAGNYGSGDNILTFTAINSLSPNMAILLILWLKRIVFP